MCYLCQWSQFLPLHQNHLEGLLTKIVRPHPQSFQFSMSGMVPKNLHFQHVSKWCWCQLPSPLHLFQIFQGGTIIFYSCGVKRYFWFTILAGTETDPIRGFQFVLSHSVTFRTQFSVFSSSKERLLCAERKEWAISWDSEDSRCSGDSRISNVLNQTSPSFITEFLSFPLKAWTSA